MKLKPLFFLGLVLFCVNGFGFQKHTEKYLIVEVDSMPAGSQVGYDICKTQNTLEKNAYILNIRYKLNGTSKSLIESDTDFIFVFYVFPQFDNLKLVKVQQFDSLLNQQINNVFDIRNLLVNTTESIDNFEFIPLIRFRGKLFRFANADIFGQAFNLKEDVQYFPTYKPLISNRYELNFLSKPYTRNDITLLQRKMAADTTGLKRFDYDGFNEKWHVKAINKSEKIFDFWIQLTSVPTGTYSFGRFAEEIRYKLNFGVIGFKLQPLRPFFDERHMTKYQDQMVAFNFKNFLDIRTLFN